MCWFYHSPPAHPLDMIHCRLHYRSTVEDKEDPASFYPQEATQSKIVCSTISPPMRSDLRKGSQSQLLGGHLERTTP